MPVATGRYPTTRYGLVELDPKPVGNTSSGHLAHLRHPIIGDSKHGDLRQNRSAAEHFGCQRLMLHASQLALTHPFTGEPLVIRAGWMTSGCRHCHNLAGVDFSLRMKGLSSAGCQVRMNR